MPRRYTLTDTQIKHAKPKSREFNLSAGRGLYLRISAHGTKSWLFNYFKPLTKQRTNIGLGTYPEVSLEKAKKKRDEYRALLAEGLDPKTVRTEKDAEAGKELRNTFETVFYEWLEIKRATIGQKYFDRIKSTMELHVLPGIGKTPITKINAPLVIESLQPLSLNGTLETLRKVCGWLNEILVYAANVGKVHSNPLSGIKAAFKAPRTKNHPTIKPDELPMFLHDMEQAPITLQTRCLLEWILHTWARPSEAASTKWEEIDFEKALWRIPAEKMKMKRDHIVPLTPQALQILEAMRPISGHREFVFPSQIHPRRHTNPETPNNALKRMGYRGRLVAHGIRALASTTMNEEGFDAELIEVSLAHVDSSVRGDYNRAIYLSRRRELMEWWSNHISTAFLKARKS